ncbi:MAG TPA: TonB-dependent receptor [Pyrinomonadaceae bacterium]|nr:TonB-dependent receptor [Pyrinomonadaceae bacterium]
MMHRTKQNSFLKKSIAILAFSLVFCFNAFSQAGTAVVTGAVGDPQGNRIPGAKVTLIGDRNNRREAITNESGVYTFTSVQPGSYRIEVEATGFKKASVSAFQAAVDSTADISVQLEVGQVTETVTVNATGVENIINTQDASVGNHFTSQQIEQLPLQGRNVANLLSLQAAVTPDGSVAGGRSDQANITLDGVDVNEQQTGSAFTPVLRVNPDSVDEFRVTTSNPDASKGRSAGAQISLITKSGTNDFRGALYEYHRNTVTTANDFFNNLSGIPRPKLIRNLFGGRLAGPIVKDRFFFFYNYEGMREAKQVSVVRTVPLPSLAQGTIRFRDNQNNLVTLTAAQINALTSGGNQVVDVNPAALAILASAASRYTANDTTVGDGLNTGGFRFNAPAPVEQNGHTARFDWIVTEDQKHQISLRGNYIQDLLTPITRVQAFPDTPAPNTWSHPLGIALTHTWLVRSNMTNRLSYGLTRLAFSDQGDSDLHAISFRDVFSPFNFNRTFARVNPTHNFTNDFNWIKGNHSLQFGTNIRIIRNKRSSLASAFDSAVANFGFYQGSGGVLLTPLNEYLRATTGDPTRSVGSGWTRSAQTAMTAVLGRLSQYSANYNFGINGQPLPAGEPIVREWATEEYDFYAQDSWRVRPNLTLTLGLRYGLSMPVYETQGYQAAPNIPLQEYFQRRVEASARGQNYNEPLIIDLAGPKNGRPGFYKLDKNNFQPRIAVAWQPNFQDSWLGNVFGRERESVFRAGFAITNDYFGQQLAVTFDANNTLGFSTTRTTPANSYNITTNPAPLITGLNMSIRNLAGVAGPSTLTFPQQQPANNARRIEHSLDTNLVSPINYSWNIGYTRELPFKTVVDINYIGRAARNLLATRDVMMPNNLTDPVSGQTYYQAATILEQARRDGLTAAQIQPLPFFENIYGPGWTLIVWNALPGQLGQTTDWTWMQDVLDSASGKRLFYQSQYGALSSFGTIAKSDYNAMAISVRQRLRGLTWDFNYTYSLSKDDASGLQTSTGFGSAFILNPLRQEDNYAVSDFDLTHIVNFNSLWDIPIGRNRPFFSDMNKFANIFLGGWQLSSVFRYNTGYPIRNFFDDSGWVTNWNLKSGGVLLQQVQTGQNMTTGTNNRPNLFSNPQAAYNSFRSPFPGETGTRNALRFPYYIVLDAGLAKSFQMPWNENHKVTFRWDVFNVTNTARLTGLANFSLGYQPDKGNPPANWANFTTQQGSPRVMQFALRYDF